MPNNISRFRADLIDVAWGVEDRYGLNPLAGSQEIAAHTFTTTQVSTVDELWGQFGLVTGGVDLPNPSYEWTPFFGLGVLDRNMMFPVQGRERLEGRIGGVLMCHDASRLFMEQAIGLIFNGYNLLSTDGASVPVSASHPTAESSIRYVQSLSTSNHPTAAATTWTMTGALWNEALWIKPASSSGRAKAIIIVADKAGSNVDRVKDTWAYIGYDTVATQLSVFQDRGLQRPGWNGILPAWADGSTAGKFSIHSITRESNNHNYQKEGVTPGISDSHAVIVRPTLTQESFMLAARFRADDGSNFVVNYKGCKVARTVFNFEEGNPVNFGVDFIARDMRHNIGQDDGTGSLSETLKYSALQTTSGADTESSLPVVIPPNNMKNIRVTEQPHFFSRVELTFQGTPIARFRRFSITVDNQLDPRYYLTQNDSTLPADDRQVLHEILEGRRNISFSGSLDMDNAGSNDYPATDGSPTDALFLRYLLNQMMTSTDVRSMDTLKGIGIKIEVRRMATTAGAGGPANTASSHDKWLIYLPSTKPDAVDNQTATGYGTQDDVGLVLRSATHNVPAPPNIHVPVDIDGFASSMHMEFMDNVAVGDGAWSLP
jgi:hypothetical protein